MDLDMARCLSAHADRLSAWADLTASTPSYESRQWCADTLSGGLWKSWNPTVRVSFREVMPSMPVLIVSVGKRKRRDTWDARPTELCFKKWPVAAKAAS